MEVQQLRRGGNMSNTLEKNLIKKYPLDSLAVLHFTTVKEPATIQCNFCNKIYEYVKAEASYKKRNHFCSCVNFREKTHIYQQKLSEKYPKEELLLVDYKGCNSHSKSTVKCVKCNSLYHLSINVLLNPSKYKVCHTCFPGKAKYFTKLKRNFLHWYKITGYQKFTFPINFNDIKQGFEKLESQCVKCDKINFKTMSEYMANKLCLCEANNTLKTHEQFLTELKDKGILEEYLPLEEYQSAFVKIKVKHICGFIWKISPHHLLMNKGCPKCNRFISKGEKLIEKILNQYLVPFVSQYPIKIDNKTLFIDFLIDGKIGIEFQGIQHFQPIEFFGGEAKFQQQKLNDSLKKDYCYNNNIDLIYYDYTQSNDIIEKKLLNLLKFNDYLNIESTS